MSIQFPPITFPSLHNPTILASNNQPIDITPYFPNQNQPINTKTSKLSETGSRGLAGVHHRQAIHQENPETGLQACVA